MKDRNVEEKDIENVLKILEDFSASETSRLKIQVSEEEGLSLRTLRCGKPLGERGML